MSLRTYASADACPAGDEVKKGRSILGLYPATDPKTKDDFAAWRKANNR